jgi:nucleoside-diphosphate-sugar epimerase
MQTILGAGGSIGKGLAKNLTDYSDKIRLVSRNPKAINPADQLFSCDLTNKAQVSKAVKGSEIAYLVAGLNYNTKIWQEQWPVVMKNVLEACKEHNSKLVFFDNIYMYDPASITKMTEEPPVNPVSKKGEVRAKIAQMLLDETKAGNISALIARSADFYGPGITGSIIMNGVYENLMKGKKANWFCSLKYRHSATFTPDASRATAMLGNSVGAYGQVWHLPTAGEPPTGKEWIEAIASAMGVKPKVQVASKSMVWILGLFNPILKEFTEMLYQYDRDYVFDSSKFEKAFGLMPTPYSEGIKQIVSKG